MRNVAISAVVLSFLVFSCGGTVDETSQSRENCVIDFNPSCAALGDNFDEIKFDPPVSGTISQDGMEITIDADGYIVDWSSNLGIDAVIVKGGPNANVVWYDPESTGDTGLTAPINPNTQSPYGLSHITFCYDWELAVSKTAEPSLTRNYDYTVDKTGASDALTLSDGQTYSMAYTVAVELAGYTDSDWAVSGAISVNNPSPYTANVTGVADSFGELAPSVDCGVEFPYELGPGATLECSYAAGLDGEVNGTNVATAETTGKVQGDSGSAEVDFAKAVITEEDACVDVDDDQYGALGQVCADDELPVEITYSLDIGPYAECGTHTFVNTATITEQDSGATASDSWTVTTDVPCSLGCTLTPGYWKTHSEYGPAPYDDTWAQLPSGADTPFFESGLTYYETLWEPPRGNAYLILANAYIAAQLNGLNGASSDAVSDQYAAATALLEQYDPSTVAVKGKDGRALRAQFIELAEILDEYNNGLIGPGHCDE